MLAATPTWRSPTWTETTDTMTTRTATLVTIGLIACLLVGVAMAALYAGDISERSLSIVTSILGTLATVLAGLLLFLRVETVSSKVDDVATAASVAAEKAAVVERKVDKVHDDVLNGPMRQNVKLAIKEAEDDPEIRETRIENAARGVSKDRHDLKNRRAAERARAQMEERVRRRGEDQG